jgi:hypothetical protein
LEFVPVAIDFCTELLVKLDATLIPLRDPPLDHATTGERCLFGDSFHQEFADTAAAMRPGNIKFLDNQVWLRSIGERNEMINEKSNQVAAFFSNETMKIGRRTVESLFAQHVLGHGKVIDVFFELR